MVRLSRTRQNFVKALENSLRLIQQAYGLFEALSYSLYIPLKYFEMSLAF